jgi:hypothetical protein
MDRAEASKMALQLGALRDALIDAGARPDKAAAASEELASYDNRVSSIEGKLAGIESRLTVLTWAVGVQASLTLVILGSMFAVWSRLGDITGQLATVARSISH